ncbi:MAG TPA: CBS domain-containing protein [Steroidobacteraceae bacterium]|nr:CBS domain-containing protein [Steroidobacteraceae bacterium]
MTTSVLTVDVGDPAGEVLRLFAGYPVHHLPVLDQGKVVGMLSSADVMKLELFLPKGSKSPIAYLNERLKVGALVRRPVLTVQPHQPVEAAAQLMAQHGVHALAVVDAQDHLLGIITTTDIMDAALRGHEGNPAAGSSAQPTEPEPHMLTLTPEQFSRALAAAKAKSGTDRDPDFVHQALCYTHARVALLEQLRHVASRFMQAGQDQQLHTALRKAIDAVNRAEQEGYIEAANPV